MTQKMMLGFGLFPETVIVKSEGFLVPPLVLSTLVITLKNVVDPGGGVYWLVTVHIDCLNSSNASRASSRVCSSVS